MNSAAPRESALDPIAFRAALSRFPTGVCIVTVLDAHGQAVGLTINSFSSVSLDPPLVLWSLRRNSPSLGVFRAARHFSISVLAEDQAGISSRFAASVADKFEGVRVTPDADGAPLIAKAAAQFSCETWQQQDGGDHIIIVGKVVRFAVSPGAPLVFCGGRYGSVKARVNAPSVEELWPIPFW